MSFINEEVLHDAIAQVSLYLQQLDRQARLTMDAPKHLAQLLSLYYAYAQGKKTAKLNFLCHDIGELRKIIQMPDYDVEKVSSHKVEDVQRKLYNAIVDRPIALLTYLEKNKSSRSFYLRRKHAELVALEQALINVLRQFNETLAKFELPAKMMPRFKSAITAQAHSFA